MDLPPQAPGILDSDFAEWALSNGLELYANLLHFGEAVGERIPDQAPPAAGFDAAETVASAPPLQPTQPMNDIPIYYGNQRYDLYIPMPGVNARMLYYIATTMHAENVTQAFFGRPYFISEPSAADGALYRLQFCALKVGRAEKEKPCCFRFFASLEDAMEHDKAIRLQRQLFAHHFKLECRTMAKKSNNKRAAAQEASPQPSPESPPVGPPALSPPPGDVPLPPRNLSQLELYHWFRHTQPWARTNVGTSLQCMCVCYF